MATFKENIKKIARTAELEAKIKKIDLPRNRGEWEGGRGIGLNDVQPQDVCPIFYSTTPNSYDIGDIIDGLAGPTIGDECSRINTITGLTDFDVSVADDYVGATVFLVIQLDGIFD